MTEFKPPWVDDWEYCEKGYHGFILSEDGFIRCYYCGIDFREFRKKIKIKKEELRK